MLQVTIQPHRGGLAEVYSSQHVKESGYFYLCSLNLFSKRHLTETILAKTYRHESYPKTWTLDF